MAGQGKSEAKVPLEALVQEIEQRTLRSDDHKLTAALCLREARERIQAGELGPGVKWEEWARQNIKLGMSQLYLLDAIGRAKDPAAELARQRKIERERKRRSRVRRVAKERSLEPLRRRLIRFATDAPIEEVRWAMDAIAKPGVVERFPRFSAH